MSNVPTRREVIDQLDILRVGLRIAMTTIRKLKTNQKVDSSALLRKLATIRGQAKDSGTQAKTAKHNYRMALRFRYLQNDHTGQNANNRSDNDSPK